MKPKESHEAFPFDLSHMDKWWTSHKNYDNSIGSCGTISSYCQPACAINHPITSDYMLHYFAIGMIAVLGALADRAAVIKK